MSDERKVGLELSVSDAVVLDGTTPTARLKPTVCVHNCVEDLVNVGASNFKFQLKDSAGATIEDLGVALGDEFHLIEEGEKKAFVCLLRADDLGLKRGRPYTLCVDAFGKTEEVEFQFS